MPCYIAIHVAMQTSDGVAYIPHIKHPLIKYVSSCHDFECSNAGAPKEANPPPRPPNPLLSHRFTKRGQPSQRTTKSLAKPLIHQKRPTLPPGHENPC